MKTPKPEKLPSGSWRVKIQVDGKRYSCTGATKKEAQEKAAKIYAGYQMEKRSPLTVGQAIDKYIESKSKVFSPTTIRAYKSIRKNHIQGVMGINLSELTTADITKALNEDSIAGKSDKTVQNAYGLLSATCREYRPDFYPRPKLPHRKKKQQIRLLSEDEMSRIWAELAGTEYELPILLASWLGLRSSEIAGLKYSDISGDRLHVQRAYVYGENGYSEKAPKTASGDRWIRIPKPIQVLIAEKPHANDDEHIISMRPRSLYKKFIATCKKIGIEPCRIHDLRHFAASEAHSLGIPDKYILEKMGHANDIMLRRVYEHAMQDKADAFFDTMDAHMMNLYTKAKEKS